MADDKIITRMLDRFKLAAEAESDNRKRGLVALKFRAGGKYQWEDQMYQARVAERRPTESHNQIPQFTHKVTNNMRMNMPQVKIIPKEDAVKETADIIEGMCREIQSSSEAEVAFDTAADNQVTNGWGYFRVLTEYEDEEDESEDQVIKIKRIANPFMVYDDPYALEQDRSDRRFAFIINDRPVDDFNDEFGTKYGAIDLQSIGDKMPGWASAEDRTIREVEYFEVIEEKTESKGTKKRIKRKVIWRKCTAIKVLEELPWAGKYIPLIFVSGEELNIDGDKQLSGLVEGLIAPQRQYNYWTNAATEAVALAPKSPFVMAVGQVKGLEKYWDNANNKSYPYLPYNTIDINGTPVPPPQRQSPSADISSFIALVQGAQQNMYSVSGIYPASLGQQSNETSGRAINARKVEGEVSNFHFPDNMARAIRFLGRILVDLIPKVYDTKRVIRILHVDGKSQAVTINAPFKDKKGETKIFDLSKGKFDVAVTTGPNYTTKREAEQDAYLQISQAYPAIWDKAGDLMVEQMDWAGAEKLSERLKAFLPPQITQDSDDSPVPPQVQQQMAQMQQVIQQLQAQLEQAAQELQSNQADIQAKQADLQLKAQEMQMKGQSEAMKAEYDRAKLELDSRKLDLEQQKIDLDAAKTQVEGLKTQIEARQPQTTGTLPEDEEDMPLPNDRNALIAKLQELDQQDAMEQEQQAMQQQKEAEEKERADMMLQVLMGIQQGVNQLTASILAPKQVVRGPDGLATGVVTVQTAGNA